MRIDVFFTKVFFVAGFLLSGKTCGVGGKDDSPASSRCHNLCSPCAVTGRKNLTRQISFRWKGIRSITVKRHLLEVSSRHHCRFEVSRVVVTVDFRLIPRVVVQVRAYK